MGFLIAMRTFDRARPGVAAQAVGIAQAALDYAVEHCRKSMRCGQPLTSFQNVQYELAEMATKIEAARALIYSAARMIDRGAKDFAKSSAMTKLFGSDVAVDVTSRAVSLCGGSGVVEGSPTGKFFRDAKITQIYEGTNEIQREVIARHIIKEAASRKS